MESAGEDPSAADVFRIGRGLLKEIRGPGCVSFRKAFKRILKKISMTGHRTLVVVTGSDPLKQGAVVADLLGIFSSRVEKGARILYAYHDEFAEELARARVVKELLRKISESAVIELVRYEDSEEYMGTTYSSLVMDLSDSLKPNDVGRLVGTVKGGGVVILITPPLEKWPGLRNLFRERLAVPQKPVPRNVFTRWFIEKLVESPGVSVYDVDKGEAVKIADQPGKAPPRERIEIPEETLFKKEIYSKALTMDQVRVIRALERLVERPRKRTSVVVIADRGRGKSSSIGIGIVGLVDQLSRIKNRVRVGVTARSPGNVEQLMRMASETLDLLKIPYKAVKRRGRIIEIKGERFSIEYWEPSTLPKLGVDVAVVDEAAGLPVDLLWRIWESCPRSVFATTVHGYEGAGRGFTVRFLKRLRSDEKSETLVVEMSEPIRYSAEDPVEKWQFEVLLLNAEPEKIDEEDLKAVEEKNLVYLRLEPEELFTKSGERILKSLFGIYVQAHYRNEPDDLGIIADAPHHSVRAMTTPRGKIVAAAQLAEEGPVDEQLDSILGAGKMPGNIVPDRIIKHYRLADFAKTIGWRIVRIAVHPELQGRGIGSLFLRKLEEEAAERGYSWIGSGFGASEELVRFWARNGFYPIHVSPERNPVSGEYTCIVIKPLTPLARSLVKTARRRFRARILDSLHDTYRDLEPGVARILLKAGACEDQEERGPEAGLDLIDLERASLYIAGVMTYEVCNDFIWRLAREYWSSPCPEVLDDREEILSIARTLQGHPWSYVEDVMGAGGKELLNSMRTVVRKLLERKGYQVVKEPRGVRDF